jgi:hypothetical protein
MSAPDTNPHEPQPSDVGVDALSRMAAHAQALLKSELALAKAELSRNVTRASVGLALLAVAFMLALTATEVLAAAAVAALVTLGLTPGWAALALGLSFLALAAALLAFGLARLKPEALAPKRTLENLSDDIEAMKGNRYAR